MLPARSLLLVGLLSASAVAETVTLPYMAPDTGTSQWFVQQQGGLQQQGNQPVFSQAGMLTLNGQSRQRSMNNADLNEKTKELTITFTPTGTLRVSRRIRFEEGGVVRVVDVFDNPLDREATVNLTLMSNTNFGVTDTQPIVDPKKKDNTLGWAANTGAERAAMSLFGGRGAKVVPTVQYRANNNSVSATLALKVPAKSQQAIVHWHGTFDTADAAVQWATQLREGNATADLPVDLRRVLVNIATASAGLPEGLELLRGGATDVLELRGGDVLRGDLGIDAFTLATDYGDVTLPASGVSGLIAGSPTAGGEGRHWLVTGEGELLAGRLGQTTVPITLAGGQAVRVPLERVARIGYRSPSGEPPEWKFDKPMAFLVSGERFRVDAPASPFTFVTRYGQLTLPPEQIAAVLLPPTGLAHQIYFSDGSRLSGVLTGTSIPLGRATPPATQPATQSVDVPTTAVARLQLRVLPDTIGVGDATVGLLGDDVVAARIEQPLTLVTAFDTLTINGPEIRSIARARPGDADVQVTTADLSTFRGTLSDKTLTLTLRGGTSLTVPAAAVRDYDNPNPFPAVGVVAKANDAMRRLNSDDWKDREAAEAELTAGGAAIVSVLESALPTQPPEARDRLTAILKTLRKDRAPTATRLTPPPAVE